MYTTALLPTRARINPVVPDDSPYSNPDQTMLIVEKDNGSLIVLTSYGDPGWQVGDVKEGHHDQTLRSIGMLRVKGVKGPSREEGQIPDRNLPHWVFK